MNVEPGDEEAEIPSERLEPEGCAALRREDVQMLCSMGIPEAIAEQGLLLTGGKSVQDAAAWYFDQIENESAREAEERVLLGVANVPLPVIPVAGHDPGSTPHKMVFVVNAELQMSNSETAIQIAHACLGLYRTIQQDAIGLQEWKAVGETKEVLSGLNAEHLEDLRSKASASLLSVYPGRGTATEEQFSSDSYAVLGIFGEASKIDQIAGSLCEL